MKFILIAGFSILIAQTLQAANLACELRVSKKDGSGKRVLKSENFYIDEDVSEQNATTYQTIDAGDFNAQVIYFASDPHIRMNGNSRIATQWVVTLEIGSKMHLNVMDLRTEILALGSDPITVFDANYDGSGAAFASCQLIP